MSDLATPTPPEVLGSETGVQRSDALLDDWDACAAAADCTTDTLKRLSRGDD